MADTVRVIALRPDTTGQFKWLRLIHDAGTPALHGFKSPKQPAWNLPGGEMNEGEAYAQVALREGVEELVLPGWTFAQEKWGDPVMIPYEKYIPTEMFEREQWPMKENRFQHAIIAYLFKATDADSRQPIISMPENPIVERVEVYDNDVLEADMVGWWHLDHLPEILPRIREKDPTKHYIFFRAKTMIQAIKMCLEREPGVLASLQT